MRYKLLGKSGLRVSELCLGTMTFGEEWGWGASKEESQKMFDAYVQAGGNFLDTANHYTAGTSEKFLGDFIASDREHFVVATKYSLNQRPTDPNAGGNHRKCMIQALHASLKRLNTDYIDLYWVHAWDFMTPVEEVMRGLDDLIRAGKILYVGVSDTPAWIVARANLLAEFKGWTSFVGLQIQYSLVERTPERDLLPMAQALDIAVTPWGILGSGVLTGKFKNMQERSAGTRLGETLWGDVFITERNLKIAEAVNAVAREIGYSPSQVAIAWLRQQPHGMIIPILGVRKLSQLQDNLGSLTLTLTAEQLRRLDEVSRIDLGFPHEFLKTETNRKVIFGETFPLIDNHRQSR
jgi:aryl-alcohol dehydrogenase-like predicted oxidoreductase